jgi:hypothetical protein
LRAKSLPLGVLPDSPAADDVVRLAPGDVLVVGTDGFSEATDHAGGLFGNERLLSLVHTLSAAPAAQIVDGLFAAHLDPETEHAGFGEHERGGKDRCRLALFDQLFVEPPGRGVRKYLAENLQRGEVFVHARGNVVAGGCHRHVALAAQDHAALSDALRAAGLEVTGVRDVTPQAHNGCRPRKRRRV